MSRRNRLRIYALVGAAALAGMLLAVIPALGDGQEDALRLHLGTDGQYFEYGETKQNLTATRCEINELNGLLVVLGANRKVGIDSHGIGVKSGGAQGTPCGRVDTTESLSLAVPASGPLAGRTWDKLRLDLELKGNAWVVVDMYLGPSLQASHQLATGSSIAASGFPNPSDTNPDGGYTVTSTSAQPNVSCASPSDSGPDSGSSDNCQWTIDPATTFNRIVMRTKVGEFSLEGSGDYGNDRSYDTLFYVANAAPVAYDDTATTDEDNSTTVSVLDNDTDGDGDTLSVAAVTAVQSDGESPTIGTVSLSNGVITYDPNGQFEYLNGGDSATDEFVYTVTDGSGGTDTAVVTVTITGVNDAPDVNDSTASGDEDTDIDIDFDITDPDDTTFTIVCSSDDGAYADDGDGTGTFTPNADFNGTATLDCRITDDGGESDDADVTVTVNPVNDDPVAVDDEDFVDDATPSIVIDVLANDTDVDGDTLTVASADLTGTAGGTITVAADGSSVTYAPPSGFTGSDTFDYVVSDGKGGTDTGTVIVYELFECGETLSVTEGEVTATYERLVGGVCDGKPYLLTIRTITDGPAVLFQPRPRSGEPVSDCSATPDECDEEFKATLTFEPRDEANAPDTGTLQYDPVAQDDPEAVTFRDMPWCEFDPFAESVLPAHRRNALPAGDSWCIVSVNVVIAGNDQTSATWLTYGIGDPWKIAT